MRDRAPVVMTVLGTRPEAIKMAPVIRALRDTGEIDVKVIATAQHRDMLDSVLDVFDIAPDVDLDIMRPGQSLDRLTARLLEQLHPVFAEQRIDAVLAQGDTTTTLAAAMASFYHRVPFGHIEAGLRTGDMQSPFPEEMNRVFVSRVAQWHYAPTESARDNLLAEGIAEEAIEITGNTVIDALHQVAGQVDGERLPVSPNARMVLVTMHRRENFGTPLANICQGLKELLAQVPDIELLFPVHPNPNVAEVVLRMMSGDPRVHLVKPLNYVDFVAAMKRSHLVITDSGGVQEEAPALGKPVLVLRNETERPEAVDMGVARLVGTDGEAIVDAARELLENPFAYCSMARGVSPYGDGQASRRIVGSLQRYFSATAMTRSVAA